MITIPSNKILQSKAQGDTLSDIVESFNLELSRNYGAIGVNRTKKVTTTSVNGDGIPFAFAVYANTYVSAMAGSIMSGGVQPADEFTSVENISGDVTKSDLKVFNKKLYFSSTTTMLSSSDITTWSTVVASGLTDSPHILEVFKNRLYITDNYSTILSIDTSDTLVSVGSTYALNLNLSTDWTITCLRRVGNLLWFGLLNTVDGTGMVGSWDGASLDANSLYELPSGVVAGCSLDNIFYILDIQGSLKAYAGSTFVEKARLFKKNENNFSGSFNATWDKFIHPNGMQTTDKGTILMLIRNTLNDGTYEDTIPSGVYEYDTNIGLYHKYSLSNSATTGVTYNDFGQQRLYKVGAICTQKPSIGSTSDNGTILMGGALYPTGSTSNPYTYGIFCDDSLDTTLKYGYFITSKIFGDIQQQWKKIYALYKKFTNTTSKIIIKYRTEEDTPTETVATWTDIDRFTSSVSLSSYGVGDEIHITQGWMSGFTAHIREVSGSTYIIDETLPSSVIGLTSKANISHWIKAGETKEDDKMQFKPFNLIIKNTSPFIQFKVCMQFNGKDELNKLQIISQEIIKE